LAFEFSNTYLRKFVESLAQLVAKVEGLATQEIDFSELETGIEWRPAADDRREKFVERERPEFVIVDNLFERDDELHLDFIEAASNLRATNYGLGSIDRFLAHKVAGKIEPAVTTTASICAAGLMTSFLITRELQGFAERGKFVVCPFSLITFPEPSPPTKRLGDTEGMFTAWDFLRFGGWMTIRQVRKEIEERTKRRIACWATSDGVMLPGAILGPKQGDELTFEQIFGVGEMTLEVDASLEMEGKKEFALLPVLVALGGE
jgi:hypothetical protein